MVQRKTLLIVDDDADLRGALAEQLQLHEEFAVVQAETAGEGARLGKEARPDLILLDVDLPDMDGREACRLMRKGGVTSPIIMLTAAASRRRHHPGPRFGGQRLSDQALPVRGSAGPHPQPAAQSRGLRRRGLPHRPL